MPFFLALSYHFRTFPIAAGGGGRLTLLFQMRGSRAGRSDPSDIADATASADGRVSKDNRREMRAHRFLSHLRSDSENVYKQRPGAKSRT